MVEKKRKSENAEKCMLTSFGVCAASECWSKCTTDEFFYLTRMLSE